MTWQPGQPVITDADVADWQAWKKASKLESQRFMRRHYRRIDYYPDADALQAIEQRLHAGADGSLTAVINALVVAGADVLPE